MNKKLKKISGYSETKFVNCYEVYCENINQIKNTLKHAKKNNLSICCKGKGYSYGDIITNENNIVLNLSKMNQILEYNKEECFIAVEPGVSISQILNKTLLDDFTITACPGSFEVTIGGAVSNNVHGKDSHSEGNFISNVISIEVIMANGIEKTCSKFENEELFNYLLGGMGLFCVVTKIYLKLRRIKSPFVESINYKANNFEEIINIFEENKSKFDFMVAWIDTFAKGKSLGRGFVNCGKWVKSSKNINSIELKKSLTISNKVVNLLPKKFTWTLVKPFFNRFFLRIFNILFFVYNNNFKSNKFNKILFTNYNFIHNNIPDFKSLFYPNGFLEIQPLIPKEKALDCFSLILQLCQKYKLESMLAGLKLHKKDGSLLSYSQDGYSLGIVLSLNKKNRLKINKFSTELFDIINSFGGLIYLAKDEILTRKYFKAMYPDYEKFNIIKKKYDPDNIFNSDLYKRLIY